MERKKILIMLCMVVLFNINGVAGYRETVYEAFISGNMQAWKDVVDEMQKLAEKTDAFLWELVNYQYGYIAWCLENDKKEEAAGYLGLAERNLSVLEKSKADLSTVYAYKAAFYGFRIGLNPVIAPFTGPRSYRAAERALQLDGNNWFGYFQKANIMYNVPPVFGGSKEEAIQCFLKAKMLIEKNSLMTKENWNYLSLLTTLVRSYEEMDDLDSALSYCEVILRAEPRFAWLKDELYPRILGKRKKQ